MSHISKYLKYNSQLCCGRTCHLEELPGKLCKFDGKNQFENDFRGVVGVARERKRQYDTLSGGGATWLTGPGLMLPQAELRSKARSQSQAKANALA